MTFSEQREDDTFYRLYKKNTFDYLSAENHSYTIDFRIVRFTTSENSYKMIITNLPQDNFLINEVKRLYAMGWGIETSFRELKYTIALTCFHSKKVDYIE